MCPTSRGCCCWLRAAADLHLEPCEKQRGGTLGIRQSQVFLYLNMSTMRALIVTVVNLGVSCRVLVCKRLVRDNENDHMKTSSTTVENQSF